MTLEVLKPGLQSTLQGAPRTGLRHLGVPASGPADALSMSLVNYAVGNPPFATAIETTLTGVSLVFEAEALVAVGGAANTLVIAGEPVAAWTAHRVSAGESLTVGAATAGVRSYVAVAGGIATDEILGSTSTYLPAAFGGLQGRALKTGDRLSFGAGDKPPSAREIPTNCRPHFAAAPVLRICHGPDLHALTHADLDQLCRDPLTIGQRCDRMGIELKGTRLRLSSDNKQPSAAVFPGTLQCPTDGTPFLLGVDAQTTGGYAWLAQVARMDRHWIGQLRPGTTIRFALRTADEAAREWREKLSAIRAALDAPDFRF